MRKILFDCDNTMGIKEKDVDDGLALLYLLGREDVEIKGITTVFGNSTLKDVNQATNQMLKELEISEIPFHSGAKDKNDLDTAAAKFLVKEAKRFAGDITLLATGALTNLKAAYQIDDNFFNYFEEIVLMGGVTEALKFNEKEVKELNLSCDPEAAKLALEAEVKVTLATGNLCLDAFFNQQDWDYVRSNHQYIADYIREWYFYGQKLIGQNGFYLWDLVSALYITHPELYADKYYNLESQIKDLKTGKIILQSGKKDNKKDSRVINIPTKIKDVKQFKEIIFTAWSNKKSK